MRETVAMKHKLTVLITCKNERNHIRACIESVRSLADEILVADSGSTDDTLDIVREIGGCRVIERDTYVSAGNFKNWAIPHAAHPWVLVVDSDERVTDQLADDVRRVLSEETPAFDGYRIRFQTYVLGHRIRYCGWNTTTAIRLFRSEVCRYREMRVHADVDVSTGKVGFLRGKNLHYTCPHLTGYMDKVNRYTSWSAEEMTAKGRHVGFWGLIARPPFRFFQMYIFRGVFLDGVPGLIVCMKTAFYTFMKYAKLWEAQNCPATDELSAEHPPGRPGCRASSRRTK